MDLASHLKLMSLDYCPEYVINIIHNDIFNLFSDWESKPVDSGKWSPLRVAIFLEEANKISASMKKDTVFSRSEVEHGEARIQ